MVCLMCKNINQEFAGAIFGVSQSTVSATKWHVAPQNEVYRQSRTYRYTIQVSRLVGSPANR